MVTTRAYCEAYFSDVWARATETVFASGNAGWTMILSEAMRTVKPEVGAALRLSQSEDYREVL